MKTLRKIPVLIIAVTFLITHPVAAQARSNAMNKLITIPGKVVRIDSLLKIFSKQTGLEFSFNSAKISPEGKIAVPSRSRSLSQWLQVLRSTKGVQYRRVGNHIVLIDNNARSSSSADKRKLENKRNNIVNSKIRATRVTHADGKNQIKTVTTENDIKRDQPIVSSPVDSVKPEPVVVKINKAADTSIPAIAHNKNDNKVEPVSRTYVPETKSNDADNSHSIRLVGGYARHGSGDLKGIFFGAEYINYLNRKISLAYNFRASINHGKDEFIVNNVTTGSRTDASIRYTTAGVQVGVNGGVSIFRTASHEFIISAGPFFRYQSASNGSDGYSIYSPQVTGQQTILVGYDNKTPAETFSLGGILQLQYNFDISSRIYLGAIAAFQTDTNGDAIPQAGLVIGRRL